MIKFKGVFKKWYCPHCNKVIKRKDVIYQEQFMGHYINYWFRCLVCGEPGAMTLDDRLAELATVKNEPKKHKVITLCGSTKFKHEFIKVQRQLTLRGNVVISLGVFSKSDNETLSDETCEMLSELHKSRIDLCDEIFVINKNQYIGDDTKKEIEYAIMKGKDINYLETQLSWEKYDNTIDITSK